MDSPNNLRRIELEDAANVILELDDSLAMILLGLEALDSHEQRVDAVHGYATRPAVAEDIRFMREDSGVRSFVAVLARFGNAGRYCRLDGLASKKRQVPTANRRDVGKKSSRSSLGQGQT